MTVNPAQHVAPATDAEPAAMHGLPREVIDSLRRYITEADRLSQTFCDVQGIHRTDLHALLHLRDAARAGEEVGAGQLAAQLGLSTGATTAVIDRLERDGHVKRERASADRRRINVRFGQAVDGVARAFFRPMGARTEVVLRDFTDDELRTVLRFLDGMTDVVTAERTRISDELRAQRTTQDHPNRAASRRP
jgi:DNA-binding MarR family transcriptional regulator